MKLIINHRTDIWKGTPVETYTRSYVYYFKQLGHEVLEVGEGHKDTINTLSDETIKKYDLYLDIDSGRNKEGNLHFSSLVKPRHKLIKRAAIFTDSHGYPTEHKRLSQHYDNVFFAVWDKRDIFSNHPSAHWCPNASDPRWFSELNEEIKKDKDRIKYDFGFIGSKHGLDRANSMTEICKKHGWFYRVEQVGKQFRHRWPHAGVAMAGCRFLFNRGQKHDGPNLRVIESMMIGRALITDIDERDGMNKIFRRGVHYLGYTSNEHLEEIMKWCMENPDKADMLAENAYSEVINNHQIKNRVKQILGVCG